MGGAESERATQGVDASTRSSGAGAVRCGEVRCDRCRRYRAVEVAEVVDGGVGKEGKEGGTELRGEIHGAGPQVGNVVRFELEVLRVAGGKDG